MYKLCKTGTVGLINNGSWTTFDLPNTVYKKGTKYYLHTKFELWNTGRHQIMFRKQGRHRTGEWSKIQHSNTWPHHPPFVLSVGPPDLISLLLSATFDKHCNVIIFNITCFEKWIYQLLFSLIAFLWYLIKTSLHLLIPYYSEYNSDYDPHLWSSSY